MDLEHFGSHVDPVTISMSCVGHLLKEGYYLGRSKSGRGKRCNSCAIVAQ